MAMFKIYLTSEEVLSLPLNSSQLAELFYDLQKQSEVSTSEIEVYRKSVQARIELGEKLDAVRQLGWLSEETGLNVLKSMDVYDMTYIKSYELPQSHKDFLKSLSKESKSELKGSFLGSQIEIEFVSKTQPIALEVKEVEGFNLVVLPERKDYFDKSSRLGDARGYVVNSTETSAQLENCIYQIEVAMEKAIFKNPGSGTWWKFFNMPWIEPIFSEAEFGFSVKGDWRQPSIEVEGKVITGFQIVGDLESIENLETESIYHSDYSENSFIIQVAKDLGIKSVDETYVVKGMKEAVETEYWKRVQELQTNGVAEIKEYATSLGLDCEVSTNGLKFYPSILVKEGEFEFTARLESKYSSYSVQVAKKWLDSFDEDAVKYSYQWGKAYESFLAKDLPTV